ALGLVALEEADDRPPRVHRAERIDVREQRLRRAGILGRDHVDRSQKARCAQGQVLEVADRRAHDVERSGHSLVSASMSTAVPISLSRYFLSRSSIRFSSWRARSRLTL